jgi:hypothetical protein
MLIEFIGSTGAGKTTLIGEVQRRLRLTTEATTAFEWIATPLGLRAVTHPTLRNLTQEIAGLPFFIRALPRHKVFVTFALRLLARQANLSVFTVNNLRSLVRKVGVYEILRRAGQERILLVDEGTVLAAHNLFVYSRVLYTPAEVAQFAALLPLPDLIVYVRVPVCTLLHRSLNRRDPPRELRAKSPAQIETYLRRAVALFDQLATLEPIRQRLLLVENPESVGLPCEQVVEPIVQLVLNFDRVKQRPC